MKLLIAYDGSEHSDRAIDEIAVAGIPGPCEALVVCVAERWLPPPTEITLETPPDVETGGIQRARDLAEAACERVRRLFPAWDVRAEMRLGSPATALLECAEEFRAELVVVGSHGRSGLDHLLLGSVSEKVAAAAHVSVRIARGPRSGAEHAPRLLIGLDASEQAHQAIHTVLRRSWPRGTEVTVFTAVDGFDGRGSRNASDLSWIDLLHRNAKSELRDAGLVVAGVVAEGDPRILLPRAAKEMDADCIFVGSHGRSRLQRLFLGSVASAVARRAGCSVEIVRGVEQPD